MVSHADRTLTGWEYSLLLSATVERARASGEKRRATGYCKPACLVVHHTVHRATRDPS